MNFLVCNLVFVLLDLYFSVDQTFCFQVFSMFPGFNQELMPKGREKENQAKIKRYMIMMDSMTNAGNDSFP